MEDIEVVHQEERGGLQGEFDCESYKTGEDVELQTPRYGNEVDNDNFSKPQRGPKTMSVGICTGHLC